MTANRVKAKDRGGCNFCNFCSPQARYEAEEVWEITGNGIQVRMCDKCAEHFFEVFQLYRPI